MIMLPPLGFPGGLGHEESDSGLIPKEGNDYPLQYIGIYFPGESHGQRSLVHEVTELDATWQLISNKEVDIKVIK